MTYDLYDLILDLTEAGFTVQFKPQYADENWTYKPTYLYISIQNDKAVTGNSPKVGRVRELGQDELVRLMMEMEKYIIVKMAEDNDEPSTTAGSDPTE